jgi:hypothetical protein
MHGVVTSGSIDSATLIVVHLQNLVFYRLIQAVYVNRLPIKPDYMHGL